jgi:hypothetical protein
MRARSGRRRWCAACASSLFFLATARASRADPLDLVWDAPETCNSGADVRREFERSTSIRPGRSPPHLSARARVEARDGRWVLHLHTLRDGVEGDREIEADSCASLTRAAALVLALAFGEGAQPEAAPTPEAPVAPPAPIAPTLAAKGVAGSAGQDIYPSARSRRTSLVSWSVTLDGRIAWGPLPGPAAGAATTVDARGRWWGVSARVISWPGANGEPEPDLHAHFTGVGGALSLCLLGRPSRAWILAACAGLEASALRGTSTGATFSEAAVAPWLAAIPALRARLRLVGPLHVEAGVEVAASLMRPSFAVCRAPSDDSSAMSQPCLVHGLLGMTQTVYVVPEISPSGSLGLSLDI